MPQNQPNTPSLKQEKVNLLLARIEEQLNWGPSQEWNGADFERLSDLIFEKSQKRLSVTTLKRSWGRTSQSVKQSNTTLDILSQYQGSESWRDFIASLQIPLEVNNSPQQAESNSPKLLYLGGGLILSILILFMVMGASSSDKKKKGVTPNKEVKLDIQKVTKGIPNTVLFRYDVGSTIADTFELQQSWDERKRIVLDPTDSMITSTYFSPGYFNAKLVADG